MKWSNWSGEVRCEPTAIEMPDTTAGVAALVQDAAARNVGVRVAGSGHSFSRVVETDDVLVDLQRIGEIEHVDRVNHRARLGGGARISKIGAPLAAQGLALLNQGDIHAQAIAGAVSTGTHGTGIELGSLSSEVTGLTLVTGEGQTISCSATEESELFHHARVAVGTMGVITSVEMQMRAPYLLREKKINVPLQECLERTAGWRDEHRHFEFFWFPYSELAAVKLLDVTEEPRNTAPIRHFIVDQMFENSAWWAACQLTRSRRISTPKVARFCAKTFSESARIGHSYEIFPNPRWVRFNEMEYAVPAERGPEVFLEIKKFIEDEQLDVVFPIEYRYVKGDNIPLSPFYKRDSAVLSCHVFKGKSFERYFRGAEQIFLKHGGRPHWGKMHQLDGAQLRALYPEWDEFQALRGRLDPKGLFISPYM
ncbi:MAG: D-arabinono-1,4-lactone oxidase, partial [Nannocystaceae bacterium]